MWQIHTVVTVAYATVRNAGYRWVKASDQYGGTAGMVRDIFAGKAPMPTLTNKDAVKAWEFMCDLTDRERLWPADQALRTFLIECGRRGGVRLEDVPRVSVVAAYGLNGVGKNYPRREAWESYAVTSQWQGTEGHAWKCNVPITIDWTHDLKPRQGTTKGGRPYRYLGRLYRAVGDDGNVYKWCEWQRSRAIWHDLTKWDRVTLMGGMVELHDAFTAESGVTVRFTEFAENTVTLDLPW